MMLFASSSADGERITVVDINLLATLGAVLLVVLLDRLFVVPLVMLPVALLRALFVIPLITMPPVPVLFTWLPAPMSRIAVPVRPSRTGNRREKYCMRCAPL